MTDIIERAEAALEGVTEGDWAVRDGFVYPLSIRCGLGGIWERDARFIAAARTLVPELIDTLKDTRAQLDAWKETADHYKWSADEVGQLRTALKAARADNERLKSSRWIETIEELQELEPTPDLCAGVLIKALGIPSFGGVFELNDDGTWNEFDSSADRVAHEDIPLPAVVLWIPQAAS